MDPSYVGIVPRLGGVGAMVSEVGASRARSRRRAKKIAYLSRLKKIHALSRVGCGFRKVGCGPRLSGGKVVSARSAQRLRSQIRMLRHQHQDVLNDLINCENGHVGGSSLETLGLYDDDRYPDFADGSSPEDIADGDFSVDDGDAFALLGAAGIDAIRSAVKKSTTPEAYAEYLSGVFMRFARGEQPKEKGGENYTQAELKQAVAREKAYRDTLSPDALRARVAMFARATTDAHQKRREARKLVSVLKSSASTLVRKARNTALAVPGVAPATKTLAKVLQNPVVTTIYGPIAVPAKLSVGFLRGGPDGALSAAKEELRNPARRAAVSALGTIFPPAAPAAVALNAANVMLDAYESKDPVAAVKAAAQLASIAAGSGAGDPHMKEIASVVDKVNTARSMIPKSATPALASARAMVCGAKSEDARGAWFKLNVRRDGNRLVATLYSAAGGNAEVSTFSVDVRPFVKMAKVLHARMHDGARLTKAGQRAALDGGGLAVSGVLDSVLTTAEKLGTAKLRSVAAQKSNSIAKRAGCQVEKPPAPVSDAALATYAAARAGVEAVDNLKRVEGAVKGSTEAIRKYGTVKKVLLAMPPGERAAALKRPEVRKAVIDGVAAKGTAATFVNAGGVDKLGELREKAALAQSAFRNVRRLAAAGDPDAKKVAAVVSVAARARADVQSSAAMSKGGLPGLVIGPNGKLTRGRFAKRAPNAGEGTSLIMTRQGLQAGVFDAVSGSDSNPLDVNAEDQLPFELRDDVGGSATKVCCYGG